MNLASIITGIVREALRAQTSLEWGTVGWAHDNDHVDFGDGSAGPRGVTLVKVTLYHGRKPGFGRSIEKGIASGVPVIAHLDARLWRAPANGTRVVVAFPGGDMQTIANGSIVFVAAPSPTSGFDASTMMLPVPDGETLNIGDENAHALGLGSVLGDVLNKLLSCTPGSQEPGLLAIKTALTSIYGATPQPSAYATEKVKAT